MLLGKLTTKTKGLDGWSSRFGILVYNIIIVRFIFFLNYL